MDKPILTVTVVLVSGQRVALIKNSEGNWQLPEKSLEYAETMEQAINRISSYAFGCDVFPCNIIGVFDDPDRIKGDDHVVTTAYSCFSKDFPVGIETDMAELCDINTLPMLSRGHRRIMEKYQKVLMSESSYSMKLEE
jgi:ADP-ribose pyrophosphatase YjhB (NUDIX family)